MSNQGASSCCKCGQEIKEGEWISWTDDKPKERKLYHGNADICIKRLVDRQDEHLALIARLTKESITRQEAEELRRQIGSLVAEVGTLRSENRTLKKHAAQTVEMVEKS